MHRYLRFGLFAAAFLAVGVLYGCLRDAADEAPTDAEPAEQNVKYPRQVQIIRHGEKTNDDADIHLSSRGAARAAALPSLFVIPPTFSTKPAALATPDFLFATRATKHSNRPVETLTPLAKAFGDRDIHHKIANDDFPKLVEHIFTDAKYAGKTLAICWHHGNIPELAQGIAAKARNAANLKATIPIRWEGAVFDRVWILTFENDGNAAFANLPQRLLFGDSKN